MLFDSHTHLNNEGYTPQERQALIEEIAASDVSYVMDVGFDLASSKMAAEHAEANEWLSLIHI